MLPISVLHHAPVCSSTIATAAAATMSVQTRAMGRRQPKQGKPPILPPSKKVLYHVVNVPWQKPDDVQELLWRRHVYNNAVTSLREVFRAELQQNATVGKGIDAMKEAEAKELDELIAANERRNLAKSEQRRLAEESDSKAAKLTILEEIEESLLKEKAQKLISEAEVAAAISRSSEFVSRDNLESKILAALEKPTVYDFAIDRAGNKYENPTPVKYQEGTPTRQKGRLYDETLGVKRDIVNATGTSTETIEDVTTPDEAGKQ